MLVWSTDCVTHLCFVMMMMMMVVVVVVLVNIEKQVESELVSRR